MDKVGNYRNPEIQALLSQYISEEKYGDYKPIIDEIIQRRAFEYHFSKDRMETELQNLNENLQGFELADKEKMLEIGLDSIGAYSIDGKKIFINAEYFKDVEKALRSGMTDWQSRWGIGRRAFHTLTHEIYHAINQKENGDSGLSAKDEAGIRTGSMLNELVTESAARRTLLSRSDEERRNGYVQTEYYQTLSSTTALIANAIGVSENQLLAHGLNDRKEFENFVYESLPETMDLRNKERLLSNVFFKVAVISRVIESATPEAWPGALSSFYKSFFKMARECMSEEQKNPTKENVGSMHYRAGRIWRIANSSIQYLKEYGYITEQEMDSIINSAEFVGEFDKLQDVVLDTYKIQKGESFDNKSKAEIEQSLLQDMLQDPEYSAKRIVAYSEDNYPEAVLDNSVFLYTYNVISEELKEYDKRVSSKKVFSVGENSTGPIVEALNLDNNLLTPKSSSKDFDDDDAR